MKIQANGLYAIQNIHIFPLTGEIGLCGMVIEAAPSQSHWLTSLDSYELTSTVLDDLPFLAC